MLVLKIDFFYYHQINAENSCAAYCIILLYNLLYYFCENYNKLFSGLFDV